MRALTVFLLAISVALGATVDLAGNARDPFATPARARVFLFVRSDCPITNRYAPEMRHLSEQFASEGVEFWLVYSDPSDTTANIQRHLAEYGFPGQVIRDRHQDLVKLAHVTTAPEAALFDANGKLVYHGRIDDLWVDLGRSRPQATTHDLADAITAVLEAKPVRHSETRAVGCTLADIR